MENQDRKQNYYDIHYKPHVQVWFWLLVAGVLFFIVGMIMNEMQSNVSLQKGQISLISMIFLGLGTLLILISLIWYIAVYFGSNSLDTSSTSLSPFSASTPSFSSSSPSFSSSSSPSSPITGSNYSSLSFSFSSNSNPGPDSGSNPVSSYSPTPVSGTSPNLSSVNTPVVETSPNYSSVKTPVTEASSSPLSTERIKEKIEMKESYPIPSYEGYPSKKISSQMSRREEKRIGSIKELAE